MKRKWLCKAGLTAATAAVLTVITPTTALAHAADSRALLGSHPLGGDVGSHLNHGWDFWNLIPSTPPTALGQLDLAEQWAEIGSSIASGVGEGFTVILAPCVVSVRACLESGAAGTPIQG